MYSVRHTSRKYIKHICNILLSFWLYLGNYFTIVNRRTFVQGRFSLAHFRSTQNVPESFFILGKAGFSFSWRNSNSLIRVISGQWLAIYKSAIYVGDGGTSGLVEVIFSGSRQRLVQHESCITMFFIAST